MMGFWLLDFSNNTVQVSWFPFPCVLSGMPLSI
jgi:hypothetical protein